MDRQFFSQTMSTIDRFKIIVEPLKQVFGLSFGYMRVFPEGQYYILFEEKDCLEDFITYVDQSSIFYSNVMKVTYIDGYYFSIWPNCPNCPAMELCYKYNQWNGITISKIGDSYTELWWFTGNKDDNRLKDFFIGHKKFLLDFIHYFNSYNLDLLIPNTAPAQKLFQFKQGFHINIPLIEPINEASRINEFIDQLKNNCDKATSAYSSPQLTPREIEVLKIICRGYTAKTISQKLHVSVSTIKRHIEHIKHKAGLHFKTELIELYEKITKSK